MTTNDPETTPTVTAPQGVKPHRLIKLGVDVHWRQYVAVRQIDGAAPQPPQRFTPEEFVAWAKKQTQLADEVHCCYEAGPFGFVLHKRLVALGVKSLVVRPRNWDEYGKKVKTDRCDALALVSCLDRYLAGNTEALTVNPRVRHILIEASWRLQQFQPDYKAVKQRRAAIDEARSRNNKATKKKLSVGLARQFIVDWWRIRTGRTTPEKLGLQMSWPAAYVLRGKAPAKAVAPATATDQPAAA